MKSNKLYRIFTLVTAFVICLACMDYTDITTLAASPYVVTVYNEKNGLPTGEANTVLQTSDGYIWIGSYGGLIRYDGTDFRNYSVEGAITSSSVRSLFEDSKGRLWIGTNDSGVVVMEKDVFTEIVGPEDKSFLCVRDFYEGADGTIYAASNSGIAEIEENKLVPYDIPELEANTVYSVAEDRFGRVWGSTNNGDCVIIKDGKLVDVFTPDRIFSEGDIYSVAADENGNIILGSGGNNAARIILKSESLEKGAFDATIYNTGKVNTHNSVEYFSTGHIFVSGINGFAVIAPNGEVTTFDDAEKAMSVNKSAVDYENNIWLASSAYGIIKYSQACFDNYNNENGLGEVSANAVAYSSGNYYIAHDTGLIVCDDNWVRVESQLSEMFDGVRIRCIIADSSGGIWIAGYSDTPIVNYDPVSGKISSYDTESGITGTKARVVYELSDGRIAAGTQTGVSIIENGIVTETYTYEDGLENPSVLCFADGPDGSLLVGSDGGGIYEISDGRVTEHSFDCGLEEGVVLRMLKNSDENGWFISAGSSLYYWKDSLFTRLTNFTKGAGSIFEMYEKDGRLYLLQNNGIVALDKAQLLSGEKTDTISYGANHGLTGSINANTWHWLSDSGQLYISTRSGISIFGFKGVENDLPKITVNSVETDNELYEHPEEIEMTSGNQRITINYSALSFADTNELRVSYQLKGFDRRETLTTEKSGSVSYTNLPGGSYTFEIKVFNPENPEEYVSCSIPVKKSKFITEQPLFWIIVTAVIILVTVLIVTVISRVKLSNLRRRHEEYRAIIEQSLLTFAKTIDAKDPYTNGHSIRVAKYSRELARRMNMTDEQQENIYYIALLHDIGKIGIPDHILNKPGKLTPEEREIIQKHVDIGGDILKDFTALSGITNGAQYHHERYDGKGYSKGLKGEDIPLVSRIIAVADTYDAMSSDRCYRKALGTEVIINEFKEHNGAQFDPEVTPHILDMIDEGIVPMNVD